MITAKWHPDEVPESSVKFSRAFDKLDRIEKLDFLQDTIYDLQEKYNFLNGFREIA